MCSKFFPKFCPNIVGVYLYKGLLYVLKYNSFKMTEASYGKILFLIQRLKTAQVLIGVLRLIVIVHHTHNFHSSRSQMHVMGKGGGGSESGFGSENSIRDRAQMIFTSPRDPFYKKVSS